MGTATAATQANVTVATIRTWCRRNVIPATKRAGRWTIDAASLTHRITLGREHARHRKNTAPAQATRPHGYRALRSGEDWCG